MKTATDALRWALELIEDVREGNLDIEVLADKVYKQIILLEDE